MIPCAPEPVIPLEHQVRALASIAALHNVVSTVIVYFRYFYIAILEKSCGH